MVFRCNRRVTNLGLLARLLKLRANRMGRPYNETHSLMLSGLVLMDKTSKRFVASPWYVPFLNKVLLAMMQSNIQIAVLNCSFLTLFEFPAKVRNQLEYACSIMNTSRLLVNSKSFGH